ncbi:hypothetical protein PFISCL1PPCAC_22500, partial [Pristionchus fissidentatus]
IFGQMADSEGSSQPAQQDAAAAATESDASVRRRVRIQEEVEEETVPTSEHQQDRWAEAGDERGEEDVSGRARRRSKKRRDLEQTHFKMVNDRVVDDITMDFFYKPHTVTLLLALCAFLLYKAIWSPSKSTEWNVYDGAMGTLTLFLIVSALAFPTGPFIRPHPVIWRMSFGLSVAYALVLQFTVFQKFDDVKKVLSWLDPDGLSNDELVEKEYAVNCSDLTWERMWSHVDIFAFAHFSGWVMKALLIRHGVLCWYISIIWELTEVVFTHLLPNFAECWWDSMILDVLLCNGLGIWVGLKACDYFQMRTFYWESIKDIETTRGKVKRAVLQFTPESFIKFDWFNESALRRTGALTVFCLIFLLVELNTFFVKHIFAVDTSHPVVFWRLIMIGQISAPSIRQFYVYATDPLCKRLGMQSWVFCAVTALESAVCIKFGRHMFPPMQLGIILGWMCVVVVGTFAAIWVSIWWRVGVTSGTSEENIGGQMRHLYVDSSYENLGLIHDDVRQRRKQLRVASESEYTSDA